MVQTITYDPRFKDDFRRLNLQWIETHFRIEPKDLAQVDNPEECLVEGGQIFFVVENGEAVGTCALYAAGPGRFELAKMAVRPDQRGKGWGDVLMREAETWARAQRARELILLSNTILAPAIALYKKHGYETTHLGPHPDYDRCNIEMRKTLVFVP